MQGLIVGKNWNGVLIIFTHLATIQTGYDHHRLPDEGLWNGEYPAAGIVDCPGNVLRNFHMLFLIEPNRNHMGSIQKYVCGHENRIIE